MTCNIGHEYAAMWMRGLERERDEAHVRLDTCRGCREVAESALTEAREAMGAEIKWLRRVAWDYAYGAIHTNEADSFAVFVANDLCHRANFLADTRAAKGE